LKAATDKSPNPRSLAILARLTRTKRNYKEAADTLKKALELQPDDNRLANSLAEDLLRSGQLDDALKIYGALAARNPKEAAFPMAMAEIYLRQNDYAKAHGALDKAKKIDADAIEPRMAEVRLFKEEGKLDSRLPL